MRFKLKTLLILVTLISVACVALQNFEKKNRLWRDKIFYSTSGGTIEFPSGLKYQTNQWLDSDSKLNQLTMVLTDVEGEFLIDEGNSRIAVQITCET